MARGKFRKPQRGGGHHFSRNLGRGGEISRADAAEEWENRRNGLNEDGEDDSDEEDDDEVDDIDQATPTINIGSLEIDDPKVSSEEESEPEQVKPVAKKAPATSSSAATNPNRAPQRGAKMSELAADSAPRMSRRDKEQAEKAAAKERYWKLHEQGKTDEAKADLARLKKIRAEREAAAAARKADQEEKAAAAKAKLEASGKRR